MRLTYIANVRLPTEKAHGIQIVKTCEAFARSGEDVTLIVPKRWNQHRESVYDFYGIPAGVFLVKSLPTVDVIPFVPRAFRRAAYAFASAIFLSQVALREAFRNKRGVMYSRDILAALLLAFLGRGVFLEIHDAPGFAWILRPFFRRLRGVVAINGWNAEHMIRVFGVKKHHVLVSPDGVDVGVFSQAEPAEALRQQLGARTGRYIVLYAGHLYDWKGVKTLAEASRYLDDSFTVVFVGGTPEDVVSFAEFVKKEGLHRVCILGQKAYREIPGYLAAADCLVVPNSGKSHRSRYATSPLKVFEYLAAKKPIVASRLPSLCEILTDGQTAVFFAPDDPGDLAVAVRTVKENSVLARTIAENARILAESFTWEKRAQHILEFMSICRP